MTNKTKNIIILILIAIIVSGSFMIYQNINKYESTKSEIKTETKILKKTKIIYEKHKEDIYGRVIKNANKSDNHNLKTMGEYAITTNSLEEVANKFFKVFFNWSNGKEYLNRANQLTEITTEDLRNDKQIFDDGLDTTGENYIDNVGLKSSFIDTEVFNTITNGNEVTGIAKVNYESWYKDQRENSGNSTSYYKINYNQISRKIEKVEKVFPLK